MDCQICRPLRSRSFVFALCASVCLLALHTRVCGFESYKPPIKSFADDYDRLKVGADENWIAHALDATGIASQFIKSSGWGLLAEFEPRTPVAMPLVPVRLLNVAGPGKAIRPPPLR